MIYTGFGFFEMYCVVILVKLYIYENHGYAQRLVMTFWIMGRKTQESSQLILQYYRLCNN